MCSKRDQEGPPQSGKLRRSFLGQGVGGHSGQQDSTCAGSEVCTSLASWGNQEAGTHVGGGRLSGAGDMHAVHEGWLNHVSPLGLHPDGDREPGKGSKLQLSCVEDGMRLEVGPPFRSPGREVVRDIKAVAVSPERTEWMGGTGQG